MPRKPRINYTETDKALMWDRWKKGESLEKIAQLFDRSHGKVARILRQTGGIRNAEIMAGTVLAGEISLAAAISSLDWVSSHEQLGRNDPGAR